jgi:hypothetical protein
LGRFGPTLDFAMLVWGAYALADNADLIGTVVHSTTGSWRALAARASPAGAATPDIARIRALDQHQDPADLSWSASNASPSLLLCLPA